MIMAGVFAGQLPGDFTTEVPDPTIASTHPEVSSAVRSMIVHWGAPFAVDAVTTADPQHRSRYDQVSAVATSAAHGFARQNRTLRHYVMYPS